MTFDMDNSKATTEWLNSRKQSTKWQYQNRWEIWLDYCKIKGLLTNGSEQLEDMKKRRLSNDNTEKYFYDMEIPRFFMWLQTEYKGKTTKKPLSESSALSVTTAIRGFFSYQRYSLEISKEALPSSEKVKGTYEDHAFDIYQLRSMFNQGDLLERTVLACGKDLFLRVGDFVSLNRDLIELHIKREMEIAENEHRESDIVEFELNTEKEKESASCHLSRETIELLKDYLKTYPKKNGHLFPLTEDALNDMLRRLAEKAKITVTGRIRFHCLRKFGITVMHGQVKEPVMKYIVGKNISKDLRTYIQNNRETFKAFKLIEPQISLTKTNGNGSGQLAKQLEEMQKQTFKQLVLMKVMSKMISPEKMANIIEEVASEIGVAFTIDPEKEITFEDMIEELAEILKEKDLERILKENGNNNH